MKSDNKTTSAHLKQNAYICIRQSTEQQVRNNIESQQQQDELTIHSSHLLNQEATVVIDYDLSGSGRQQKIETLLVQFLIKHLNSSVEVAKEHEK